MISDDMKNKGYIPIEGLMWSSVKVLNVVDYDNKTNTYTLTDGENEIIADKNTFNDFFLQENV